MSNKRNSDLKERLKALRVNEPLKLSKNGPGFRPPETTQPTEIAETRSELTQTQDSRDESPRKEIAQNEAPNGKYAQKEHAPIELASSEFSQSAKASPPTRPEPFPNGQLSSFEEPRSEKPSFELARNQVPHFEQAGFENAEIRQPLIEQTRLEKAHVEVAQMEQPYAEKPQREIPRNELPIREEAQIVEPFEEDVRDLPRDHSEVPECKQTQFELPYSEGAEIAYGDAGVIQRPNPGGGFFKLSHGIFANRQLQRLPGDCFRLFLWMSATAWRFPKSNGVIRASVRLLEENTAMSHATVSRSLKALREAGLIALVRTDFKNGNIWRVSVAAYGGRGPEGLPYTEPPQTEAARKKHEARSERESSSHKTWGEPPQKHHNIKNINNLKNLSQEGAAPLLSRIEQIAAPEKRRSESVFLNELLEKYPVTILTLAVEYLDSRGVLGSGERCHSVFRYLATAAEDVIKAATKLKPLVQPAALPGSGTSSKIGQEDGTEALSAVSTEKALASFEAEFAPEERTRLIEAFIGEEYPHGYLPPKRVIEMLTAKRWFQTARAAAPTRFSACG